jgi:hypothetical protein
MDAHTLSRRVIGRPPGDKAMRGARRLSIEAPGVVSPEVRSFWLESQRTGFHQYDRYGLRRVDGVATHF